MCIRDSNKDPRLLYFFQKNAYTYNVVQAYFDHKREMTDFVEKNVISEVKNGKKVFKEWGGPGEPWVRYYGLPVEIGCLLYTSSGIFVALAL